MTTPTLTPTEAADIGASLRNSTGDNLVVASFAAELIGESYPFSTEQMRIVFHGYTDEELGRRFAKWADEGETP